jgi:hypothetical protein
VPLLSSLILRLLIPPLFITVIASFSVNYVVAAAASHELPQRPTPKPLLPLVEFILILMLPLLPSLLLKLLRLILRLLIPPLLLQTVVPSFSIALTASSAELI